MSKWFLLILVVISVSSCTINKNLMFKTDTDYEFDTTIDSVSEYLLAENDRLSFVLMANDATPLINQNASLGSSIREYGRYQQNDISYIIDINGKVDFPELGFVSLLGLTKNEARIKLEELYSNFHVDPYVQLEVLNRRVIVFTGSGGGAKVIGLKNDNTNLIEALAEAGGIASRGDASKVKLIRTVDNKEKVFLMDLSTIEGIQFANIIVQSNDIIYVEPVPEIARELVKDAAPIVSLISSVAIIWTVLIRFNGN